MLWVKILRLIFLLLTYLIFKTSSYWVMTFYTTQTMKFSTKDFFIKCGQIHRKRLIGSHLLKKYLMENFIFCALLKLTELEHFSILKTLPSGSSSQYAHTKITRIRPPPPPPLYAVVRIWLDPPLCVRTFYILFRFKFSSLTISRLYFIFTCL